MENENQNQVEGQEVIRLDETPDALLQAIVAAPDDGLDELVQNLPFDVYAFQAFLKASGQQDSPDTKAIIETPTRKKATGRRRDVPIDLSTSFDAAPSGGAMPYPSYLGFANEGARR
jgi:hypothetical protein